ncbi:MAG: hypothetical protein NUW09_02730 [Deltaproteobacteria bacterium]|nr:hypothetical protein [Deltaproteobacteria bacterium]
MKVFSTIHKRIHRSFRKELKKLFFLNGLYLDEEVYFMVQDSTSREMQTMQSGRMDFLNAVDIMPVSDPNITSRAEKLTKARDIFSLVGSNPLTSGNQDILLEATKNLYEAMEVQNADRLLPKPEEAQPPDLPPQEENAGFIRDIGAVVLPTQDHMAHMEAHHAFMESEFGTQLTPHGKKLFEAHDREHLSMLYLQSEQEKAQMSEMMTQAQMMGGMDVSGMQPGGSAGMEAQPIDPEILAALGATGKQPA